MQDLIIDQGLKANTVVKGHMWTVKGFTDVSQLNGLFGVGWDTMKFEHLGLRGNPESRCIDPTHIVLKYNADTEVSVGSR